MLREDGSKDHTMMRLLKEWFKVAEVLLVLLAVPAAFIYHISFRWPGLLDVSYVAIVGMFILQAALSYGYTTSVLKRKPSGPFSPAETQPLPKTTFIVTAYLPNEVPVIEATLVNILQNVLRPPAGIEVILVYNTPHAEPLEGKLREMTRQWPELILTNADGSRSKSENLNHALELAHGDMIVLLDADHLVSSDCIAPAWRWMEAGYDVVQGGCKIRNTSGGIVPGIVGIEFEVMYGVHHPARSVLFDTGLFGGSNGYWRAAAIKKIRFDANMLTEDIDTTLRGILAGLRFVHDEAIVSTELAPVTLGGLWFQRKRWLQGWLQCALKYQRAIWKTGHLNLTQKFSWTTQLGCGVVYDLVAFLFFPVVLAIWFHSGRVALPAPAYSVFAFFFILLTGPYQAAVMYRNAVPPRDSAWRYALYIVVSWPYTLFKTVLHMVAIRDELAGERAWTVSKRG